MTFVRLNLKLLLCLFMLLWTNLYPILFSKFLATVLPKIPQISYYHIITIVTCLDLLILIPTMKRTLPNFIISDKYVITFNTLHTKTKVTEKIGSEKTKYKKLKLSYPNISTSPKFSIGVFDYVCDLHLHCLIPSTSG